jgi:hypothetical protein
MSKGNQAMRWAASGQREHHAPPLSVEVSRGAAGRFVLLRESPICANATVPRIALMRQRRTHDGYVLMTRTEQSLLELHLPSRSPGKPPSTEVAAVVQPRQAQPVHRATRGDQRGGVAVGPGTRSRRSAGSPTPPPRRARPGRRPPLRVRRTSPSSSRWPSVVAPYDTLPPGRAPRVPASGYAHMGAGIDAVGSRPSARSG